MSTGVTSLVANKTTGYGVAYLDLFSPFSAKYQLAGIPCDAKENENASRFA